MTLCRMPRSLQLPMKRCMAKAPGGLQAGQLSPGILSTGARLVSLSWLILEITVPKM